MAAGEQVARLAARHGDEVVTTAFQKVGPRAVKIAEEAGEEAGTALRILARHGDDALDIAGRASARQLVAQYGDDAADAILRHGPVGERIVAQFAEPGAKALMEVGSQNARRMSILAQEGVLSGQLLDVIAKCGDRGCDFIWRNKAALTVGATLAAFVASPEPFIEGSVGLTTGLAEHVAEPVIEGVLSPVVAVPVEFAKGFAHGTNWTVVVLAGLIGLGAAAWYSRMTPAGLLLTGRLLLRSCGRRCHELIGRRKKSA
jgi:hypothetical protein